jgi:hypothetical protein
MYAPSADRRRLMAVMDKINRFFEEEFAVVFPLKAFDAKKATREMRKARV